MVEEDLGEATIVYEDRDGETEELTVQNEHVAYFQDHWIVRTGEDDRGRDRVRRIPHGRVYHVERTVQAFEEEVKTLRDQVQSFAEDLRSRLPGVTSGPAGGAGGPGGGGRGGGTRGGRRSGEEGSGESVVHIDVDSGEDASRGTSGERGEDGTGDEDESAE